MQLRARVPSAVLPLVLAVAAGGYLAGLHRPPLGFVQEPVQAARSAGEPGITLERPRNWLRSEAAAAIPGLPLQGPLWLKPAGAAGVTLLAGTLPLREGSPLPPSLLGRLRWLPQTEVVDLDAGQAFRYRSRLRGSAETLELYVLPARAGEAAVLACQGPLAAAASLRECEQIVATVTPQAQPAGDLTPDPRYGARLSALIAGLPGQPLTGRAAVASWAPAAALRFAKAARALALLEPPPVAAAAHTQLTTALSQAGLAYGRLALAARVRSGASFEAARGELVAARGSLRTALRTYALLGYRRSDSGP